MNVPITLIGIATATTIVEEKLLRKVIQEGIETKVLMLSATPVNNRFNDLRNQLALAYEGDPEKIDY